MKRTYETIAFLSAIVTLGGALHYTNYFFINNWISKIPPAIIAYVGVWAVELSLIIICYYAVLSFWLIRLPKNAKRMGVWIDSSKNILDILSAKESVNTMVVRYGLRCTKVHHLRVWSGSGPANITREQPVVEVKGLPSGHSYEYDFEDKGNRRYYNIWFSPPLEIGRRTIIVELLIKEKTHNQYYMFQNEIPRNTKNEFLNAGFDYYKNKIVMPTRLSIHQVIFPLGFLPTGRSYYQVRVGDTENPIPREEKRLKNAVKMSRNEYGRCVLTAEVKYPIFGASYFLLWRPPESNINQDV